MTSYNGRECVSNHQPHDCLLNRLFRRRLIKKTSKLRVSGLCVGNSPVNSPHKWPVTRKMFPFDDVIMGAWNALALCLNIDNLWPEWHFICYNQLRGIFFRCYCFLFAIVVIAFLASRVLKKHNYDSILIPWTYEHVHDKFEIINGHMYCSYDFDQCFCVTMSLKPFRKSSIRLNHIPDLLSFGYCLIRAIV